MLLAAWALALLATSARAQCVNNTDCSGNVCLNGSVYSQNCCPCGCGYGNLVQNCASACLGNNYGTWLRWRRLLLLRLRHGGLLFRL